MSLLEPHNLPFAAALGVMLVLSAVQAVGIGDLLGDQDVDAGVDVDPGPASPIEGLLSLIGIGRVPFMIWLALLLVAFAGLGLGIQALAESLAGAPLDTLLGVVLAAGAALPVTGLIARPLGAILPGDETTAVSTDELAGRRAHITDGVARGGSPARARVVDRHGMTHHVMVEPHEAASELHAGDEVLLVRREGELFFATALAERRLSPN